MLLYITFALSILATVLHFIAPKTKNTYDDKAAELVDEAQKFLPKA